MMHLARAVIFPLSILALSIGLVAQANAQGQAQLEEVLVTAEHREANLQDTQISISALSASDIKELGISNSVDLGHFTPNVTINKYQGGKSGIGVNMRGVGQNETIISFDPAVGVYLDDVLISKNVGALFDVLDLERIEILRGPQGTLYGRNTMGGTVNYITKKPTDEFEGSIAGTLGRYDQRDIRGILNIPLAGADSGIGALSTRLTAGKIKRDGSIDNKLPGAPDKELETRDREIFMAHLQWQPTDNLTALYTYDRSRIDETPPTPFTTGTNPASSIGPVLLPFSIGYRADRPDEILVNGFHVAKTDVDGHTLHIDYNFSDNLTLKSITAYREMKNQAFADSDGSPVPAIQTMDTNEHEQLTQEFRLVGAAMDDRIDYVAGFYYMDEEGDIINDVNVFGTSNRIEAEMENDNWAVYGQASYYLSEKLRVTAGLRYTDEEKSLSKTEQNIGFIPGNNLGLIKAKDNWSRVSPMASVSYDWTADIMTYLRISSGYQSGGLNVRDQNPVSFQRGYDEETMISYELGLKSNLGDRVRLNGALWFSDYKDKRINNFDAETLGNIVTNAEKVEIWGIELEMLAQLSDHFQLGATYGYTDPEFKEYNFVNPDDPTDVQDLSKITNFSYSPENTASAYLRFDYPLGFASLIARVDWSYKDKYNFLAPQPERNFQGSYDLWNARVSLDEIDGPGDTTLRVSAWGKNLTDESYFFNGVNIYPTFGFDINLYAEPRTYGVDLELLF